VSTLGAVHKDPRDILLAPVVSEKSYSLLDEGKYTFLVDPRANKTEIKIAIETVFGSRSLRSTPSTGRARPVARGRGPASVRTRSAPS
jgi:large subunit ribosomal protein L23